MLETIYTSQWNESFTNEVQQNALTQLENGQILFFPALPFVITEQEHIFLSPDYAEPKSKNIVYSTERNKIWGVRNLTEEQRKDLKAMLRRYAQQSTELIKNLLPEYQSDITLGRTNFRSTKVGDCKTSIRKDDRRIHIDAFPSAPMQGKRIIRMFCNINPAADVVWKLGEPFNRVAKHFLPEIGKPMPGLASLLRLFRITKSKRSAYDFYMLNLHNKMKADLTYQDTVQKKEIAFKPATAWIAATDNVSYAVSQGQYILEQTFYLPVNAMHDESLSPLRVLENMLSKKLV